jgi:hypothetical protein
VPRLFVNSFYLTTLKWDIPKNFSMNDPTASKDQIQWEFEHLRKADTILFWFPKESICPIALYELGAWYDRQTSL